MHDNNDKNDNDKNDNDKNDNDKNYKNYKNEDDDDRSFTEVSITPNSTPKSINSKQ